MGLTCTHGHDLTLPNAYRAGSRRCRKCHAEARVRSFHESKLIQPDKYRTWAREAWAAIPEADRALISLAFGIQSKQNRQAA